jgi:hypothetical protein
MDGLCWNQCVDARVLGLLAAVAGAAALEVGLLVAASAFGWFRRFHGDFRFGGGGVPVYAPLPSMLIVSVALTILVNLLRQWWHSAPLLSSMQLWRRPVILVCKTAVRL